MWREPGDRPDRARAEVRFGVGVQVIVRLDRTRFPDSLAEDPVGVIVAPGELSGSAFYAPTTRREASWEVQFEEPFYGLDGSGPHDSAVVPQGLLEAAPGSDVSATGQPES